VIVSHALSADEAKIYCMMKQILISIRNKAEQAKIAKNKEEQRLLNSYKLVMVLYLRQAVVCPLLPITSIVIESSNVENKSALSQIILTELQSLKLQAYLNNVESVRSTRLNAVLNTVDEYKQKTIIFSCFTTCLDLLQHLLQSQPRPVFRMDANMSSTQRGVLIKRFEQSKAGVMLLSYEIGAQGLNLQFATTVMLLDYWWNAGKTEQAIGRIFRLGQVAEQINVIFFSANTAVEKMIFEKQNAKLQILDELKTGKQTTKIPKIKMDDIIKLIELDDNKQLLQKIHNKK